MKRLLTGLVLSTALTFSFSVYADAIHNQLMSGNLAQIKQASQQMTSGQGLSQENLDLLAEFIASKYKKAITSEVDTLAWGTKALAASGNGRYRTLLTNILNSGAHKKLKKYAKKALVTLPISNAPQFVPGSINLADKPKLETNAIGGYIPKPSLTAEQRQLFAIAVGDLSTIKSLSQDIEANGSTPLVYDGLAQFLLKHSKSVMEYNVDTLAWICRALGASGNGRYTKVIEEVEGTTNSKKLRKYAEKAKDILPAAKNSFEYGSVDFKKILEDYKSS